MCWFGFSVVWIAWRFSVVSFRCFVVIDCCLDCIAVGILFCYYFGLFNSCGGGLPCLRFVCMLFSYLLLSVGFRWIGRLLAGLIRVFLLVVDWVYVGLCLRVVSCCSVFVC